MNERDDKMGSVEEERALLGRAENKPCVRDGSELCDCPVCDAYVPFNWSEWLTFSGVSWITAVAFLDPGNLECDLQVGTLYEYKLVWVLVWTTAIALWMQVLAARLGLVTGKHLAEHCREQYSTAPRMVLFVISQLGVVSFDVAEVIGTAMALRILFNIPLPLGCCISALDTLLILLLQKWGAKKVEAVIEAGLAVLGLCFVLELYLARPSVPGIAIGAVVPSVPDGNAWFFLVSILGSVVMGHNLFLHSGLILTRLGSDHHLQTRSEIKKKIRYASLESFVALAVSLVINIAVVAVAAAKLFPHNAEARFANVGLQDASVLLGEVLSKYQNVAPTAWAIALLCSGHAATVTGTYASQLIVEGFFGLNRGNTKSSWIVNLLTRGTAILPALGAALWAGEASADKLIVATQLVVSIQLPLVSIPLLRFAESPAIMGSFALKGAERVLGWAIVAICIAVNVVLVLQSLNDLDVMQTILSSKHADLGHRLFVQSTVIVTLIAFVAYSRLVVYLMRADVYKAEAATGHIRHMNGGA
ncbi:Metal transporter Nramp6 [Porphyridium purpureum]|uniref:Metal transporter Nramp6 n=1 Tax=Porphyridium purpureum TaxID=35688 RepID=A0A5J4Z231_PORPP|nr:Metal transporter Nramp6 [Porphyridium purpureum]|eukprot:POR2827..scf208_2